MGLIVTRIDEIERSLTEVLAREGATSDQGCSALANVLLAALVKCKRDPLITTRVADEMRRLSARLIELASAEDRAAATILADAKFH